MEGGGCSMEGGGCSMEGGECSMEGWREGGGTNQVWIFVPWMKEAPGKVPWKGALEKCPGMFHASLHQMPLPWPFTLPPPCLLCTIAVGR